MKKQGRIKMIDPDERETPEQLAEMVRNLKHLVDRANDSVPGSEASDAGGEALPPLADALGLTPTEIRMARALGYL